MRATHSKFRRIEGELIQKGICKTLKIMFAIQIFIFSPNDTL